MALLKKIFGRDDRFFDLLEKSAQEARASVEALGQLMRAPCRAQAVDVVRQKRREDKQVHEQISALVARTFISALDREDVEALSTALHRIPKTAEKIAGRLLLCAADMEGHNLDGYAAVLERAAAHISSGVAGLRSEMNIERIPEQQAVLADLEREANGCMIELVKYLHSDSRPLHKMIVLRDLCRFLERLMDRFVETGEVLTQIVLKNT